MLIYYFRDGVMGNHFINGCQERECTLYVYYFSRAEKKKKDKELTMWYDDPD